MVRQFAHLKDNVNGAGNHLLDGAGGHVQAGLQDERLKGKQGVEAGIGVDGACPAVAGVKRAHQIERLSAAHFAHNNPARIHPQAGADQVPQGDLAILAIQRSLGFEGHPEFV